MKSDAQTIDELEDAILDLPRNDRSRIAKRILTSLEDDAGDEVSPAWKAEIGRRVEAMHEGAPGVSAGEAAQRARVAVSQIRGQKAS